MSRKALLTLFYSEMCYRSSLPFFRLSPWRGALKVLTDGEGEAELLPETGGERGREGALRAAKPGVDRGSLRGVNWVSLRCPK